MTYLQSWVQPQILQAVPIVPSSKTNSIGESEQGMTEYTRAVLGIVNGFQEYYKGVSSGCQWIISSASMLDINTTDLECKSRFIFATGASWIEIEETLNQPQKDEFVNEVDLDLNTLPKSIYSKVMIRAKFVGRVEPPLFD